jgi:hypothetical protein
MSLCFESRLILFFNDLRIEIVSLCDYSILGSIISTPVITHICQFFIKTYEILFDGSISNCPFWNCCIIWFFPIRWDCCVDWQFNLLWMFSINSSFNFYFNAIVFKILKQSTTYRIFCFWFIYMRNVCWNAI